MTNIIWKPIKYETFYDGDRYKIYCSIVDDMINIYESVDDLSKHLIRNEEVEHMRITVEQLPTVLDMDCYNFRWLKNQVEL
jgi:hypothetical protein